MGTKENSKHRRSTITFEDICRQYSAPILTYYVWWILQEAEKRQIKRLYFLARDGLILKEIAEELCEMFSLQVTCCYLYVSRASLRMPTYHFIEEEEAYKLLLGYSYQVTPVSMLKRALLPEDVINNILHEIDCPNAKRSALLTRIETEELAKRIRECPTYHNAVWETSRHAYPIIIEYFRQEGLFDENTVVIVDSGWNGSMQRSLRQLLDKAGCKTPITGFYFGLFNEPVHDTSSEYLTWYFSPQSKLFNKAKFSNNLFECMCAAPHGTTLGYEYRGDIVFPIFGKSPSKEQDDFVRKQIQLVTEAVPTVVEGRMLGDFPAVAYRETQKLIRELMYHPTREIVAAFQAIDFCDDIYESYYSALANDLQIKHLKDYTVLARVRGALKRTDKASDDIPWPYGVAALLPPYKAAWYRFNMLIWEYLKVSPARQAYNKIKRAFVFDFAHGEKNMVFDDRERKFGGK